jgi:hypothetical protein
MLTSKKAKRYILIIVLLATFIAFSMDLKPTSLRGLSKQDDQEIKPASRGLSNQEDQETEQSSDSPNDADGDENNNGGIVVDVDAETLAVTTNREKPIMHTFFEPNGACCLMTLEGHFKLLEAWEQAWQARGWDTKVLTKEDAVKYPEFEEVNKRLDELKVDDFNRRCFWRWMAMAMIENDHGGGGWMSDYDTFPLGITAEQGLKLSKRPGFQSFNRHVPNIIHASAVAWKKVLNAMFKIMEEKNDFVFSDMMALKEAVKEYGYKSMMISEWTGDSVDYPYFFPRNEDDPLEICCEMANLAKVSHLSHRQTHLAYTKHHIYPRIEGLKFEDITDRRGEAASVIMKDYRDKCLQEKEAS